jgi:hypothetical protein
LDFSNRSGGRKMDMFWIVAASVLAITAVCGGLLWRQLDRRAAAHVLRDRESRIAEAPNRLPPD